MMIDFSSLKRFHTTLELEIVEPTSVRESGVENINWNNVHDNYKKI